MKKNAFTMAEVILVMVILGIIAVIMITTNKEKMPTYRGFLIQAKKVVSEIDAATSSILTAQTYSGDFNVLISLNNPDEHFNTNVAGNSENLAALYRKYLNATRRECGAWNSTAKNRCPCNKDNTQAGVPSSASSFYLKDGTCVAVATGAQTFRSIIPGEEKESNVTSKNGMIFIDVNGANEPNAFARDQFLVPLGEFGIDYELSEIATTAD